MQSFNAAQMTVVVQPTIKAVIGLPDGTSESRALPLLLDCPVVFPCGGGFTLTFPLEAGDECLVVFASRCIDSWWQSGGVQEQAELRLHDLSDGFALVGVRSQPRVLSSINASGAELRNDAGTSVVRVEDDTITIQTTATITVEAPEVEVNANNVTVNAVDAATINCDTAMVNADTSLTVNAPLSTIEGNLVVEGTASVEGLLSFSAGLSGSNGAGTSSITGDITIHGNLTQDTGNLTSNGTNLHTHTHGGVQTGGGNTGAPN